MGGVPTCCLINVMIPDYTRSLMKSTRTISDGKGISVVILARMTPETRATMAAGSEKPGEMLDDDKRTIRELE